jgi:hypothetical protein
MDALADPVERVAADTGFSSVVPVDRDDEVRLAKAYGLAHRGWGVANTIATRFAIASGTKGLTALIRGAPGDTTLARASAVPGVAVILPQQRPGAVAYSGGSQSWSPKARRRRHRPVDPNHEEVCLTVSFG